MEITEVLYNNSFEYWNDFYKHIKGQEESTFCKYVKTKINDNSLILDVGCGCGRDSFSFAIDGHEVIGIDRSIEAIKYNKIQKSKVPFINVEYKEVDLSVNREFGLLIESISEKAKLEKKNLVLYLRFLLHSIDEKTEELLLNTISSSVPKGTYFAAEFRTIEDKDRTKIYDNHYRRFINAEELLSNLTNMYNFTKISFTKSTGLSIYKGEDPYLGRLIMVKN